MLLDSLPELAPTALVDARCADAPALAALLRGVRADTLALFADYARSLPSFTVPQVPELNPPRWELGHVGWFQEFWTTRNSAWRDGARADPVAARSAPLLPGADALYDSSTVPHARRWALPLPDADATIALLARQLEQALQLLQQAGPDDDSLYFFRLALLHEAMHVEAAIYMAQALGIAVRDTVAPPPAPAEVPRELALDGGRCVLGSQGRGFAFDNELPSASVTVAPFRIDAGPRRWADVLPFVAAGGYADERFWSDAGRRWLRASGRRAPRYLRQLDGQWQQRRFGQWQPLDLAEPACHLTCHEAEAWCAWAGRRLPSEAEWECAAVTLPAQFRWGAVWEWTSSPFSPYPGFVPHPYRDYSQPWFDTHRVLRGASVATRPLMRSARYRNFFAPERDDIHAGFRSCALD